MAGTHECRRESRCVMAERDEAGRPVGAATTAPDTLCDGCAGAVHRALEDLPGDYVRLELLLDEHRRAQEKVAHTPELPVPVRLDLLDLQAAIDHDLCTWVEPVAEQLGVDWDTTRAACSRPGVRVQRAARLLAAHVPLLLRLGPVEVVPLVGIPTTWLGVEAGLAFLDHHQRARLHATGGSGDARLPVPCPRCEGLLVRPNGLAHVRCQTCAATWAEQEYERLCLVLAEDYRAVAA